MGKALSGELSCPSDRSCYIFILKHVLISIFNLGSIKVALRLLRLWVKLSEKSRRIKFVVGANLGLVEKNWDP